LDFALLKNTKITERLQAQFRAEFFNIANRTDFMLPNGSLFTGAASPVGCAPPLCALAAGGGDGGSLAGTTFGFIAATAPNTQREIQFGLKLIF
jgi:hypothetical protein